MSSQKFNGKLNQFSENSLLWESYIEIPKDIYDVMIIDAPDKRVLCRLNDCYDHYCAMLTKGDLHYILLNKSILKSLKLTLENALSIELQTQDLKYGIPICKELEEVLQSDDIGNMVFHHLNLGKQRSLIHLIGKYKNKQLRIDRSIILLRHLIDRKGNLDFKILQQNFKNGL